MDGGAVVIAGIGIVGEATTAIRMAGGITGIPETPGEILFLAWLELGSPLRSFLQ